MPDSYQLVSPADVAAIAASPFLASAARIKNDHESVTLCIRAAARIYAAETLRTGGCFAHVVHDHGFNAGFVLSHWDTIRTAGEKLVAERLRAEQQK